MNLLLLLILAHLLSDFVFQTDSMVKGKRHNKWKPLVQHLLIVFVITWVLSGRQELWWVALVITLLHGIIDLAKNSLRQNNLYIFVGDQVLHILSIIGVWAFITNSTLTDLPFFLDVDRWPIKYIIIAIGYILVALPTAVLIDYVIQDWHEEVNNNKKESLKHAGKWIGIIERLLIYTFIIIGEWEPIGFLLAAKSVFRFGDLQKAEDQKKTEYILIGTLLSFAIAIAVGLVVGKIIDHL